MTWRVKFTKLPQTRFLICTDLGYHLVVLSIVQRCNSILSMVFLYFQIVQHPKVLDTRICTVSEIRAKINENVDFTCFHFERDVELTSD